MDHTPSRVPTTLPRSAGLTETPPPAVTPPAPPAMSLSTYKPLFPMPLDQRARVPSYRPPANPAWPFAGGLVVGLVVGGAFGWVASHPGAAASKPTHRMTPAVAPKADAAAVPRDISGDTLYAPPDRP